MSESTNNPEEEQQVGKKVTTTAKDKLRVLEEKYKEQFKTLNTVKEANEKLFSALKEICKAIGSEDGEAEEGTEISEVVSKALARLNQLKQMPKTENSINVLTEKGIQTQKLSELSSRLAHNETQELRDEVQKLEQRLKETEESRTRLQKDKMDLLSILNTKEQEIMELKNIAEKSNFKKSDPLLDRFEGLESKRNRRKDSMELNQELAEANKHIDILEDEVAKLEAHIAHEKKKAKVRSELVDHKEAQTDSESTIKESVETLEKKLEKLAQQNASDEVELSKNYLKNLVIRYMVYEAKGNETECKVIRRAILDCLGVASDDRATIDDAINNRGGLKDAVYFLKLFGSGSQ